MKELSFGSDIRVGDTISVGSSTGEIFKVDNICCYARLNKRTIVQIPSVYSEQFKQPDSIDGRSYTVYR